MNRTNVWEYDETKELLNIMVEQDSLKHIYSRTYTNTEIYKTIEEELKKRGYTNKNEKQIENRWKNLKKRYSYVKKTNCNIGDERSLCPFYDELDSMLGYYYDYLNKKLEWDDDEIDEETPQKKVKFEYEEIKDFIPPKRNTWGYQETKTLFSIMIEQDALKHFGGKLYRNEEIYKSIERELKNRGFKNKNYKQIEYRWKNLKKEYFKMKRMNLGEDETNLCAFYDDIDGMIGNRDLTNNATNNQIDSTKSTFFEEHNDGLFLQEPSSPGTDEEKAFNVESCSKRNSPSSTATMLTGDLQNKPLKQKSTTKRNLEKIDENIKKTQEELTKQFVQEQKRLIDYEHRLYLKSEEEFQKKFDESTKKILEDSTEKFLQGLESILKKYSSNSNESDVAELIKFSNNDCQ